MVPRNTEMSIAKPEPACSLEDWHSQYRREISPGEETKARVVKLCCWLPEEALFLQPKLEQLIKSVPNLKSQQFDCLCFSFCHGDSQAWGLMPCMQFSVQFSQLNWAKLQSQLNLLKWWQIPVLLMKVCWLSNWGGKSQCLGMWRLEKNTDLTSYELLIPQMKTKRLRWEGSLSKATQMQTAKNSTWCSWLSQCYFLFKINWK